MAAKSKKDKIWKKLLRFCIVGGGWGGVEWKRIPNINKMFGQGI